MSRSVTIGTGNNKKFSEMAQALEVHGITAERADIEIDELQDLDPEKVITHKVLGAFAELELAVLVDDSGIYFDGYTDFPGVFSKYMYKGLGYEGLLKLYKEGDSAEFRTYVGYMDSTLSEPQLFFARYPGTLTRDIDVSLETEMPYAQMFVPDDMKRKMSTLTPEERKSDHRHLALDAFASWFLKHNA